MMNNKGFTLVELIATIVLLAIIMGIGAYSITAIIKTTEEKNYNLLIKEIKTSVELYYQECKYMNDNNCDDQITLGYLVDNGYLQGNAEITIDNEIKDLGLVNTKDDVNIRDCMITYNYTGGKIVVESNGQNATNSCPVTEDYSNN